MDAAELDQYLAESPPTVVRLEIEKHFTNLNEKQKRYAHYSSRACFLGSRITMNQCSPESESTFDLIMTLYKSGSGDWNALAQKAGVSDEEMKLFIEYAAMFLANTGNYKSFGDAKFIPRCTEATVAAFAATSPEATKFYQATKGGIFDVSSQTKMHLGFPDKGHLSEYYPNSDNITQAQIEAISKWMQTKNLIPENTRLRLTEDGNYELLIASAQTSVPAQGGDAGKETKFTIEDGELKGKTVTLVYGDYSQRMGPIATACKGAAENAENETQKNMYLAYAQSFEDGSMNAFKDSQRFWIKDKGPMVESNLGFVETYRDPAGIRGEWEGFASIVNVEQTKAFGELVESAPKFIPRLPWSVEFEKDKFLSPDFTSLEVLTFAGSGIPAGINIPNFDDIRQVEGFKNVSLGNVLSAADSKDKVPFIADEDQELYLKHRVGAFDVQVGLHELTGHGCGKLLQETAPGVYNFDHANPPICPLTDKPITSWYAPGQTWGSVFGSMAASYEECRAELVAMYLGCEFDILKIFGIGDGTATMDGVAGDLLYVTYLQMARAGLGALEMWDPKSQKWGQAHSQARFSILKSFLDAGDDFCKLDYKEADMSDLTIKIDRSKILTAGREAVRKYLQKIHIYKATGDYENGSKLYNDMTNVDTEYWGGKVRKVVLAKKQPRKSFVQANTFLDEATGAVTIKHYEPTAEGLIQSYAERAL